MEIVKNSCYGGFSVSKAVYKELKLKWDGYGYPDNDDFKIKSNNYNAYRADLRLIKAIKKIGLKESNGTHSELEIVEIPDGTDWGISEYDGIETIEERHKTW